MGRQRVAAKPSTQQEETTKKQQPDVEEQVAALFDHKP
jgi:hypothetical protein